MLKKVLGSLILTSIYTFAFDYNLKPTKVSNDVWCFFGELDMPKKENGGFMSNSCYIKTSDSFVLVDTGASYEFAKQSYEQMKKIADLPVKNVLITHGHDDHWLGNSFYKEKFDAKLYGPSLINKEYNENSEIRGVKILQGDNALKTKFIKIDNDIKEATTLNIGSKKIMIVPIGVKAHTSDDLYVYLPDDKVLFSGDMVMNGRVTSNRDGSVIGALKALEIINNQKWDVLVPGHGTDTSKTATKEFVEYFTLLKQRVIEAIEEDIGADEITKIVTMDEFKNKPLYEQLNSRNVFDAFRELEFYEGE
ncbi:MBL fold metallo-hydrolase [Malaciobacter pacificus]|uniref:MBL fold metallohydrolase n=1 Tax=Malaciobacter pacificus TaxID=1080223 RepID=A0A5C2H5W5_9BACT|nr:MBL fold metallo-hydrolase [Malaciobacter pacificus]QEP33749.1 MBL fold metallohydrolase [Malaciobacter pacificus]GGD33011.1 MBL fold metallo-hydrolase [Malaciobacter pacificus]